MKTKFHIIIDCGDRALVRVDPVDEISTDKLVKALERKLSAQTGVDIGVVPCPILPWHFDCYPLAPTSKGTINDG